MYLKNYFLALFSVLFVHATFGQNGLSFDGTDDKVDLGNGTNLQLNGNSLTIEAWIYPTSWRTNVWEGGIVVKEQPTHQGYMFRAGQSGRLNFAYGTGTTWKELTTAANALSLNTWQHVAVTYDGTKVRLYKNGVRIDSAASTGIMGSNANSCVIGGWFSTGRNFPGKIDEVRIWNIVRSQAEIAGSMNGEFCSGPTGLQAYYKFNQGTAGGSNTGQTTLTDITGNSNGTLQNFALTGSTSNWVAGAALTPGTGGSGSLTTTVCDSYTAGNGNVYTSSGTYTDTVTSALGCDSILTVNLTVNNSSSSAFAVTGCNDYTSPSGNHTWTTSGTYTDVIPNAEGCDSNMTITLTILTIDINVLVNNSSLTSWATGATYQWLDCNNNFAIIPGATGQTFFPTVSGDYAVEVSKNGCTDTTACYTITGIGVDEFDAQNAFSVFPNPAKDFVSLSFNRTYDAVQIDITNALGQTLQKVTLENVNAAELNVNLPAGVYVLTLNADGNLLSQKLIIE